ncbi:hypothetical protein VIRA109638_12665 [Vibrio rarus]
MLLAILSFSATPALASETDNNASTTTPQTETKHTFSPHITAYVAATYSDDWASDYRDDRNVEFDFKLGYQFTPKISAGVITGVYYLDNSYCSTHTKDYWCMTTTYLYGSYSNLYSIGDFTTFGLKGRFILPTTQYARDTKLQYGIAGYVPISFDVDRYISGFGLVLQPSLTKYSNTYKTSGGQNLTEYTLGLDLYASYQFTDKFSFTLSVNDRHYITYQGNAHYPSLSHSEEFGYQPTSSWYFGLGYTNSAQYYNPDRGPNPITGLFDDKDPHFYLSSSFAF